MDAEREDYEEFGSPAPESDSPAALIWLFAKTAGILAVCVFMVLALATVGAAAMTLLLH
jgi:hypothetical protein